MRLRNDRSPQPGRVAFSYSAEPFLQHAMKLSQWCKLNKVSTRTAYRMAQDGSITLEKTGGRTHVVGATLAPRRHDLTGRRFNAFSVEGPSGNRNRLNEILWRARCDCGKVAQLSAYILKHGLRKHCGCGRVPAKENRDPVKGCGDLTATYWSNVLRNARQREIPVGVPPEFAWQLFVEQECRCAVSGLTLTLGANRTASLDRKDSSKGYVAGNLQWVHKDINGAKMKLTNEQFIELCCAVADWHRFGKFTPRPSIAPVPAREVLLPTASTGPLESSLPQVALAE